MSAQAEATRPSELPAVAAGVTTVVLWASAFVGIRDAGEDLSAGPLALGRLGVASLVLGVFVLARRERLVPRDDLPGLLVCGLLWFAVYNVALNEAERRVDAGTAAMLVNIGPVLIALLAGRLLGEGFPRTLLTGCAIAFAGVVVIGLATSSDGITASWGTALCLVAALTYAGGVIAQKPLLEHSSPLAVTWLACCVGTLACLPFAPTLGRELGEADGGSIAWMVYLGALPTALAFTTWAYALARSSAGRMGALTYFVPPLAILMGWALLDEVPPALAIAGGALCIARRRDRAPPLNATMPPWRPSTPAVACAARSASRWTSSAPPPTATARAAGGAPAAPPPRRRGSTASPLRIVAGEDRVRGFRPEQRLREAVLRRLRRRSCSAATPRSRRQMSIRLGAFDDDPGVRPAVAAVRGVRGAPGSRSPTTACRAYDESKPGGFAEAPE